MKIRANLIRYLLIFHAQLHAYLKNWTLLYPPSERSETGGYTVCTFVCVCVSVCVSVSNHI